MRARPSDPRCGSGDAAPCGRECPPPSSETALTDPALRSLTNSGSCCYPMPRNAEEALTSRGRRREQTARHLLEAARAVLATKGYHGTKIVDIARAARVGVGTFYLYYPTKEALFLEL